MEAKGDLAFTVALEVLPKFELADFSGLTVTREIAEVPDAEVDEALERMAKPEPHLRRQGRRRRGRDGRPRR